MAKKKEIYITSQKLIQTLGITAQELINLEYFIDSDPNDDWELLEGKDYKVVNGKGLREYTCTGAFTIAKCLEWKHNKEEGWFKKLIRILIETIKGNVRKLFVREKILDNCTSLAESNNRYFLSKANVVAIFGTRGDYLAKMAESAKTSDKTALIKDEDYIDLPDKGIYYSLSGLVKLGQVFSQKLTRKNRRDWCGDVSEVIDDSVKDIVSQIETRYKNINKVIQRAKQNAGHKCQVTHAKGNKVTKIPLAGHHLYSKAEYPHLADCVDNIICITCEEHDHFHEYMGGYDKPCTIDDFIAFVKCYYPENGKVLTWLAQKKLILGNPKTVVQDHVLYLPWPIPKLLSPAG